MARDLQNKKAKGNRRKMREGGEAEVRFGISTQGKQYRQRKKEFIPNQSKKSQ
jgi:hypothetical protein